MELFVTVLHIFLCFGLILIILLQPGKSDVASAFGGGAGNQMYGSRGQGHFLGKATTMVAGLFMVTSITLAFYSSQRVKSGSDIEDAIERLEAEEATDLQAPLTKEPAEEAPMDEGDASGDLEIERMPAGQDEGSEGAAEDARQGAAAAPTDGHGPAEEDAPAEE